MNRKTWERLGLTLLAVLLFLGIGGAGADTKHVSRDPADITEKCDIRLCSNTWNYTMITDRLYTSYWDSSKTQNPWIVIHAPQPVYGLYLCFRRMPESYEIQKQITVEVEPEPTPEPTPVLDLTTGIEFYPEAEEPEKQYVKEWVTIRQGDTRFHHVFIELDGITDIRILSTQEGQHKIGFNEIFVFGAGEIPDWVQRWEPTEEKADILFFSAHPDDELLFYGGAIATYAAEKQKRVVVAYLSYSNTTRRSEALNGLWALGGRHYPEFGGFADAWSNKLDAAYKKLGKNKVMTWVTEMYRKHQPEVVVTHDLNGEYGHGQHKMMGDAAVQAFSAAADVSKYSDSSAAYGPWQAKKRYVHLWGEESDQTRFDWEVPLERMGGKTGIELAEEAYALHVTQTYAKIKFGGKWHVLNVRETGRVFSNTTFGLYASTVGPDENHTDFLEHIE